MKNKPTILVVDDEPRNVKLLQALLVPQGYDILTAYNGKEALEMVSGNDVDVILLDVMMPEVDGFEVTRQLKASQETVDIPVVLVTALHEKDDRLRGIEAGCDDFLTKPVDKIELTVRIKSLLKVKAYHDFKRFL